MVQILQKSMNYSHLGCQ